MNATELIDQLERNRDVLGAAFGAVSPSRARWKPAPEQWSILEVLRHLLDEERSDFRARLRLLKWLRSLKDPDWSAAHEHRSMGTLRAGDLLASWVAHDFFHLRQLAKLQIASVREQVRPYTAPNEA